MNPDLQRLIDIATVSISVITVVVIGAIGLYVRVRLAVMKAQRDLHKAEEQFKIEQTNKSQAQPILTAETITAPIVAQLSASQNTLTALLSRTVAQIEDRTTQVLQTQQRNMQLGDELEALKQQLKALQTTSDCAIRDLNQKIIDLQTSADKLKLDLAARDQQLAQANAAIQEQTKQLEQLNQVRQALSQAQTDMAEAKVQIKLLQTQVEELRTGMEAALKKRDELEAQLKQARADLAARDEQIRLLETERDRLKARVAEQEKTIQQLSKESSAHA